MRERRKFLALLSGLLPAASAGCLERSEDEGEFELPGTPETSLGQLPVMNTESNAEIDVEGFEQLDPKEDISYTDRADEDRSRVSFNSSHFGTGKVTGCATAAYQTAWEVPSTGSYVLEVEFSTATAADIEVPTDGDGMAATEYIVTVINYEEQRNIGPSPSEFEGVRVTTGSGTSELEEFIISTAVTMALGKALGLGFVARAVLGRIISSLLGRGGWSRSGERIVDQFQDDPIDPGWIKVGFRAEEGDILGIELATAATFGYELDESSTDCHVRVSTNLFEFRIKGN